MSTLDFDVIIDNLNSVFSTVLTYILVSIMFYYLCKILIIALEYLYFRWLKFFKKDESGFMEDKKE